MLKSLGCVKEGAFDCPLEEAKDGHPRANPPCDHRQPERGLNNIKSEDWVDVFAVEEQPLLTDRGAEVHVVAAGAVCGEASDDWVAGLGQELLAYKRYVHVCHDCLDEH